MSEEDGIRDEGLHLAKLLPAAQYVIEIPDVLVVLCKCL